jgi:hypothetical protein
VFTTRVFLRYLNTNLLPSCRVKEEKENRVAALLKRDDAGSAAGVGDGDGDGGDEDVLLCGGAPVKVCVCLLR